MSNETQQETWNATHSQLLKSVADAQAKLLAGINDTCDKLDKLSEYSTRNLELAEKRINGRLDAIGAVLAELLTVRRPVARPAKRRKRTR